jgi:ribosomal protection tetracycline resistance protein
MPKPCWAVVKFKIEPGERGSGVSYHSEMGVNEVLLKYQKEVERTIPLALEQGVKGWEVTDIKITLVGGEDHVVHSRAGDFVIATPMAIMDGLRNAGTILLEPIMKFVLKAPEEFLGQIASDLVQMRGSFHQPEILNGFIKMEGLVPAATSLEYATKLAIRTSGRGNILLQLNGYEQVEDELGVIRKFKGISPLDRAKYILKARKAIQ